MNYNFFPIICLLSVFYSLPAAGQSITGRMADTGGIPVPDANILILSYPDSAFVAGCTSDEKGFFSLDTRPECPFILHVTCIGYKPYTAKIDCLPLPDIILSPEEYRLSRIVVKGKKNKIIENKAGKLTVNVSGTYLRDEPNMGSLLSKIPGIRTKGNTVNIFGKKNTGIYIDRRKIKSEDEVTALNPSDIIKIEKINTPGPEYDAGSDGIIHIYTNRNAFTNTAAVTLKDEITIGRGAQNNVFAGINYSKGLVSQSFNYRYGYSDGSRTHTLYQAYNHLPSYTNLSASDQYRYPRSIGHNIFYGIAGKATGKLTLGIQYTGNILDQDDTRRENLKIFRDGIPLSGQKINEEEEKDTQLHNAGLNIRYDFNKKLHLTVLGDYAYIKSHNSNSVAETNGACIKNNAWTVSDNYYIYSANPQISYSGNRLDLSAGIKISSLTDHSQIRYLTAGEEQRTKLWDFIGAAFIQASVKTGFIDISMGLRGEYTRSRRYGEGQETIGNTYKNLFPYLTIEKSFNEDLDMNLTYRKSTERPALGKISPIYIYMDTLFYATGNPYLMPTIAQSFAFNMNYGSLSFDLDYTIYKNGSYLHYFQDQNDPDIVVATYGNYAHKNKLLTMGLGYSYENKYLSAMGSLSVEIPRFSDYYRDSLISYYKPIWYLQLSANGKISDRFSVSVSYEYNSPGDDEATYYDSYWVLNAGANCYLLKKSLLLSAHVYDIFRTNLTSYSFKRGPLHGIKQVTYDSRRFSFSIRYIFGGKVRGVKQESSSSDARNRI